MNTKTTWFLIALAAALSAWVFFDARIADARAPRQLPALLPGFDAHAVKSISAHWTNQTVRAQRHGDQWQLTAPDYPAQQLRIQRLLDALGSLHEEEFISRKETESQPGGGAAFGLGPGALSIRWTEGARAFQLLVGHRTLVKDQMYVQLASRPGVLVTDAKLLDALPRSPDDWRDRLLLGNDRRFDRLEIEASSRGFELQRDPVLGLWRFVKPRPARADPARVIDLLRSIIEARVQKFVTDDPAADLEAFGLASPEARLRLAAGTNVLADVQFGKSPANAPSLVYARSSLHTNVVLVDKALLALLQTPYTAFRDRALLTFNSLDVDLIDIRGPENFALQRRGTNGWEILENSHSTPADPELVGDFLQRLASLQIVEYSRDVVADFTPFGLDKPARQITLKKIEESAAGPTNRLIIQAGFSASPLDTKPDKVYARRSDENSLYAVSYADLAQLPARAFFFRNRRIWSFRPSNIAAIEIHQKGKDRALKRQANGTWLSDPIANAAVVETLFRFSRLKALEWIDHGDRKFYLLRFPSYDHSLTLLAEGGSSPDKFHIDFGPLLADGVYAAVIFPGDTQRSLFLCPLSVYEMVLQSLSIPEPVKTLEKTH